MKRIRFFSRPVFILAISLALAVLATIQLAQAQTRGGTLRLIVQPEPPILIPVLNQQAPTQYVTGKIYESLLTYSFDLKPQPGLAKSWDISPDGLTYTFHLQTGVRWHDGQAFSADDVVFSLTEPLLKVHTRARAVLSRILASVDKYDDHTVVVGLKAPFPAFIQMFEPGYAPIMPKHIYAGTDIPQNPANQTPIGTGPFMFKEWKRGEYIRLERNPHYWKKDQPYLETLIFNVIPDAASRSVAFERGNVDVLRGGDIDYVDVKRLRSLPGIQYTTQGWEMFSPQAYLVFNMHKPPFDNLKVRQAVMASLNRELIVNNIFFGLGRPSTGPFVATEMFYDANMPPIQFDIKRARTLIKESGINPSDYTIRQLNHPYGSTWERLDEYTKQALEQLGFKVNTDTVDLGSWASRTSQWDFDITTAFAYQYGDPALGVQRLYVTTNIVKDTPFANVQGYRNPQADALWEAAAIETDATQRQILYSQIQALLVNDMANGFLIDMQYPTLWRPHVKNLVQTAIGLNETFADVYLEN